MFSHIQEYKNLSGALSAYQLLQDSSRRFYSHVFILSHLLGKASRTNVTNHRLLPRIAALVINLRKRGKWYPFSPKTACGVIIIGPYIQKNLSLSLSPVKLEV